MDDLLELARGLAHKSVAPGESLLVDGDTSPALYVLLEGALRVEKHGVAVANISQPGACIGEMALLLGVPVTADVVAIEPSVVAVVENPRAMIADEPGLALALARILAARLHVMTTYLVDLKQQYADHEGGLGMVDTVLGSLMQHSGGRSSLGSERDPDPEF